MNFDLIRLVIELCALGLGFGAVIITLKSEVRHLWKNVERVDQSTRRAHERIDEHIVDCHRAGKANA
jgi:hypothetical protein